MTTAVAMTRPHVHRVLIVDDDADNRAALRYYLESIDGFECDEAADGRDALRKLQSGPCPCGAIVDVGLPEMDGWTLIERLRADPVLGGIGVVVVSGARLDQTRLRRAAVRAHFMKPANPSDVERALTRQCAYV